MKRLAPKGTFLRRIPQLCAALALLLPPLAFAAQHPVGGAHFGGGMRPGAPAGPRMMAPPRPVSPLAPIRLMRVGGLIGPGLGRVSYFRGFARPRAVQPVLGTRFAAAPHLPVQMGTPQGLFLEDLNSPGFIFHSPPFPRRPFRPFFPFSPPLGLNYPFGLFGPPLFGFGFGIYPGFWPNCDLSLGWAYSCYGLPSYGNGPEGVGPFSNPYIPYEQIEPEIWPLYVYGGGALRYVQLFLKDGTVYNVIDYWVINSQLHFKTIERNGTQVTEHTIDFDQLDLQKTVDVNTQRGFRFVLRDEPIEQYLQDHGGGVPNSAPPGPASPAPPAQAAPQGQAPPLAPAQPPAQ